MSAEEREMRGGGERGEEAERAWRERKGKGEGEDG